MSHNFINIYTIVLCEKNRIALSDGPFNSNYLILLLLYHKIFSCIGIRSPNRPAWENLKRSCQVVMQNIIGAGMNANVNLFFSNQTLFINQKCNQLL